MREPLTNPCHSPCVSCGYDLFGLSLCGRCPECSLDVRKTVLQSTIRVDTSGHPRRSCFHVLADLARCRVDAFMMVADVVRQMTSALGRDDVKRHGDAGMLGRTFREYCQGYFADEAEAVDLLAEWGLGSSEDLGRVVFAMVDAGLLAASTDDRIEDFEGLFTLATLFAA